MNKHLFYLIAGFFLLLILLIFIPSLIKRLSPDKLSQINLNGNDEIAYASLKTGDKSIYYFSKLDSKIKKYQIKNNKTENIIDINLDNIISINYSPDYSQIIIQTFDPIKGLGENWIYEPNSNNKFQISDQIGEVSFSPAGDKIAYRYTDWDKNINQVQISNTNESDIKKITDIDFGYERIGIGWISNEEIYYYPIASEIAPVPVYIININTLAKKNINQNNNIGSVYFYGDIGIATIISENNTTQIVQIDKNGRIIANFNKNSDLAKIALKDNDLLIATPTDSGDKLFLINKESKKEKEILTISKDDKMDIRNIMVGAENNLIYFISNNKLYSVKNE